MYDDILNQAKLDENFSELIDSIFNADFELIDKYAMPRGGIYAESSIDFLNFKILGTALMKGYQSVDFVRPIPKVYFEIVRDNNLNATAIKTFKEDTFLVFVNYGLIKQIDIFIDEFIKFEIIDDKSHYSENRNWLRVIFHQVIIEHELSHIFNGHLGFLSELNKISLIDENRDEDKGKVLKFTMQTLEMDADCTALSRLYGWLNNISKTPDNKLVSNDAKTLVQSFSDVMMAFYAINKFYFDLTSLSKEAGESTHSKPRERIMASFGNLLLTIKTYNFDVNVEKLISEVLRKIRLVEDVFFESYGVPRNTAFWEDKKYLNHTDFTLKVLGNWENIQPKILKHNYLPIVEQKRDLSLN